MRSGYASLFCAMLAITASQEALAAEVCGNVADDDGNGMADEECYPSMTSVCESPLSCSDSGWVSWSTGSLHYDLPPDIAPKSPYGHDIPFRRFYTSMYAPGTGSKWETSRTPLGPRWQHNYMSWIHMQDDPMLAVLHTTDGRDIAFKATGTTGAWVWYAPQAGQHYQYLRRRGDKMFFELKTLLGDTLVYDTNGRLIEIWDSVAEPNTNKVIITYTAPFYGNIDTVTDATGARRLQFSYTDDLLTSIQFQLRDGTVWTTYHTTSYAYADGLLDSVTIGGQLAQTNAYTDGNLTRIADGEGKQLVAFKYASVAPGVVSLADTDQGVLGFELHSSRAECSDKTVLYFNKGNENSCSTDSDCGAGYLCGGKTGAGATGTCFRAARCLTTDNSSGESLVTRVRALGPAGEQCTGACASVTQYVWSPQTLSLQGSQDALGNFTSAKYDANGMPVKLVFADDDADASSGGYRTVYLFYDPVYPARVREMRRVSQMDVGSCTETSSGGCARTLYEYDYSVGKPSRTTQTGYTLDSAGAVTQYSYTTTRTYDSKGRLTSIDGPLVNGSTPDGDYDVTTFVYAESSDPMWNGFLGLTTQYTSPTRSYIEYPLWYDFWGNQTMVRGSNSNLGCRQYDPARNVLTASMQSNDFNVCAFDDPASITERYAYDSALRPTRVTHPDGSCTHYEYDAKGRLARIMPRDDCNPAAPGDREEYVYDADGLLTEVDTYDAGGVVRQKEVYAYHDSRRLSQIVSPVDKTKSKALGYDERGVLTQVDHEGGLGKTTYGVDKDYRLGSLKRRRTATETDTWTLLRNWLGQVWASTAPDGLTLRTKYDDLGRAVVQLLPDQSNSMYTTKSYTPHRRLSTSTSLSQTKRFTYDSLGRLLTADYPGQCNSSSGPELRESYDGIPPGMTCPLSTTGCTSWGKLMYSKVSLLCNASYADGSLDQETFYGYDFAGRLIEEYIRDDSGRVATHRYSWDVNGNLTQVTLPSSAVLGTTYGSAASNSDSDLPTALWRTSPARPIIDHIAWNPGGVLKQYNRFDTIAGVPLRMSLEYNLANRPTLVKLDSQAGGGPYYYLKIAEDAKGRVIKRDIYPSDPQIPGIFDSYFIYDQEDRLLCETTNYVTSCPTSGSNIKNSMPAGYIGAGDRTTLLRPIAGSTGGLTNVFTLAPLSHRIASVDQTDGVPALGTTSYSYNAQGHRTADDNTSSQTHFDARTFTYDARDNLVLVKGYRFDPVTGAQPYSVRSAFDARNRRVFKSYATPNRESQWFFYYDPLERLAEVRYTPDIANPGTFTTYQLIWLGNLLVAYWQTDAPSGATSKRYVEFDETGRPVRMHNWLPGNSTVAWAIDPDAWGADRTVIGSGVYQPILFAGQYEDAETAALADDGVTVLRPGIVLNGHRSYDPFTGGYLQIDPLVMETWSPYVYAENNPVGNVDPSGLEVNDDTVICSRLGDTVVCSETIEVYGTAPNADFSGLMNLGHRGERAGFETPDRARAFRGGAAQRSRTPTRSPRQPERPAREAANRESRRSAQQPEDWWGKCWEDIQQGFRPEYQGRVLQWDVPPPVGAGGGVGGRGKGGDARLRLGEAARRLPGEGGIDYSGYDWDHRERFCQLLRKTLDNSTPARGR